MVFEKGKRYVFTDKQFNIGRDNNNRLIFIVPDSASTKEHRILAFNFQNKNIPQQITCIYNGSRLEQDPFSVAPLLYEKGKVYNFYINSEVRIGRCTVRDQENDVTYKNIKVGKVKLKRFEYANFRVDDADGETLQLTPVLEEEKHDNFFKPEDLAEFPEGRYLRINSLLDRLLSSPILGKARGQLAERDNHWAVTFLEECLQWITSLIRQREPLKEYAFAGLEQIAIALIERSDYLSYFPEGEQPEVQNRLDNVATALGYYRRVYAKLLTHEADSTMHAVLSSLEKSSRFYKPEEKMHFLDALIALEAVDVNPYMERVLDILCEHHSNAMFMRYFKSGMLKILARYIKDRQVNLNRNDRDGLRTLLRAIAAEQLLDANSGDREVERRRGILYTVAALLINNTDNVLILKALQCFTGLVKASPEYGWTELKDPQLLCHVYLTQPFNKNDFVAETAVYDCNGHRVEAHASNIVVATSSDTDHLKRTLSYPLTCGITLDFLTEERIAGLNSATCEENPVVLSQYMHHLERLLTVQQQQGKQRHKRNRELSLEADDRVSVRLVRQIEPGQFECEIVDPVYSGRGIIGVRDFVAYEVHPDLSDFMKDGRPLLFEASVKGKTADGTYLFTARAAMNGSFVASATYDYDSDNDVLCVVTGVYKPGSGYFALSEKGYPMVVWLKPDDIELRRGDMLYARVTNVSSQNDNLFVKADYVEFVDPNEERYASIPFLSAERIFRATMQEMATGIYDEKEATRPEPGASERTQLKMDREDMCWIIRVINGMSSIGDIMLSRRYALVAFAEVIATLCSIEDYSRTLHVKALILKELGVFASGARVDAKALEPLQQSCESLELKDTSLYNCLELLRILAGLDQPNAYVPLYDTDNPILEKTSRLVNAYNQIWGLGLNAARTEILKGIYEILRMPQPDEIDVVCLKVQEDEHNEFKQSLIYPADNNMHADERRQGREIMEVVAGMLNHRGGTIYLGVNNQGIPVGLDNDFKFLNNNSGKYDLRDMQDKYSLHFHYYLRTQIGLTVEGMPVTDCVKMVFDTLGGRVIGRVHVKPFPVMVRMKDGKVFYRQDSSTLPLPPGEQADFAKRRAAMASAEQSQNIEM